MVCMQRLFVEAAFSRRASAHVPALKEGDGSQRAADRAFGSPFLAALPR